MSAELVTLDCTWLLACQEHCVACKVNTLYTATYDRTYAQLRGTLDQVYLSLSSLPAFVVECSLQSSWLE